MDAHLREVERLWRANRSVESAEGVLTAAHRAGEADLVNDVLGSLAAMWEERRREKAAEVVLRWVDRLPTDRRLGSAHVVDRLACAGHPGAGSRYREWFPELARVIGVSPPLRECRRRIAEWAHGDHAVLIAGESGVGHEFTARVLHELSGRGELGVVHAAASTGDLYEYEITNTVPEGGTIYLAYADPDVRPARALELARARRSRLIVGTYREATDPGWGSELAEHVIAIPPLRARFEDLRPLVIDLCRRGGRDLDPPEEFLAHLRRFSWGGNVRHLEFMLQAHLQLHPDDLFRPESWERLRG